MKKDLLKWLSWASEIQALAQTGLTFTQDVFDKQRYERLLEIAADIMANHSTLSHEQIVSLFHEQAGYATPKIDVRGGVFQDNSVLLVKEISDQKWTLPGGWADVNHSAAECVKKEMFEESGYEVEVTKLIGIYDKLKHNYPSQWPHAYKCFFLCDIIGGTATPSIETCEVAFFPVDNLPELSLARVTPEQIARCYYHYLHPTIVSDFD